MKFRPDLPIQGAVEQAVAPVAPPHNTLPEICISLKDLPSKGLPYPEQGSIKYQPFKFGQIKKIAQSKLTEPEAFRLVLENITATHFNKEDLTLGDFFYLALLVKISTLGTTQLTVPFACNHCNKINKPVVQSDSFDFDFIPVPELPLIGEFSGRELVFMPMTVAQSIKLLELQKSKDHGALLATQCTNLPFDEALEFINNTHGDEVVLLNEIDRLLYHSLKPLTLKCAECKQTNLIELDKGAALILPFRRSEESVKGRIRFGSSSAHKPPRPV